MQITFHGGAREIGGSCIVIETNDVKIALDYGIRVGEGHSEHLPTDLDAAIISHAHLDHSGELLRLAKTDTVLVGSKATRDVATHLLLDLIKVHNMKEENCPYSNRDVDEVRRLWLARDSLALPGVELQLYPAGHVLGANMINIRYEKKNILYTGDFCLHDSEILGGAKIGSLPMEPEVLIMESTYGGTTRLERHELLNRLVKKISDTMEMKGNVLIPVFAFHRSQEMAMVIDQLMQRGILQNYNVYVISQLAQRITKYFNCYKELLIENIQNRKKPFDYNYVRHLRRIEQIVEPAIVICTSGFGHAGASLSLLRKWAPNKDNSVIISSGYLPPESPLAEAKEKGVLTENGNKVSVEANVEQIELSGHADQLELIKLIETLRPNRTFLVHGALEQALALSEKISHLTQVEIPKQKERNSI